MSCDFLTKQRITSKLAADPIDVGLLGRDCLEDEAQGNVFIGVVAPTDASFL